jgi:hypothetical protein
MIAPEGLSLGGRLANISAAFTPNPNEEVEGLNLYRFVGNDALSSLDSYGLQRPMGSLLFAQPPPDSKQSVA